MVIAIHTTSFINLQKLIRAMFQKLQSPDFCLQFNSSNTSTASHTEQLFDKVVIWEEEILNFDNGNDNGNGNGNDNSEVVLKWLKNEFESAKLNIVNESLSALRLLHPELNNGNVNHVNWISNSKWCWY
ncbi:unnamed protein product [Ambrosiozyma monospora]|uniref:Unnamed protein product n=1 Tax=Ambrosiozyma monospora TaxID=43982 RepID=A0A9W6T726_AMBMO|nr:unnamed protein product [Ambrosiozyma monospora]